MILEPITDANKARVISLELNEGEEGFIAHNQFSLDQAEKDRGLIPRAISIEGEVVGFVLYGKWNGAEDYWVTRLMIDSSHRQKGYAKMALAQALEQLFQNEDCHRVKVSYDSQNIASKRLLISIGFQETGEVIDGEVVMVIEQKVAVN